MEGEEPVEQANERDKREKIVEGEEPIDAPSYSAKSPWDSAESFGFFYGQRHTFLEEF